MPSFDRRGFLKAAGTGLVTLAAGPALARAPLAGTQVPGLYRMKVGTIEVTAILDGHLDLPQALFPKATDGETGPLLDRAALPRAPHVNSPVNTYLINTGDRLVMIDTGTATAMGPTLGLMPKNLAASGVTPDQVDVVLVTHMHPDHVNGLITPDGKPFFPNAEVVVAGAEYGFWTDQAIMSQAPKDVQAFFQMAQAAVKPYADSNRLRRISADGEVVPGITAVAAPGHTPGHTGYRIASGNQQLLVWGDIVHAAAFQFAKPDWSIAFDSDQNTAAASRKRMFDMTATDRITVAGMHLPFPGIGNVVRDGDAYRFVPVSWRPI
ncbi:MBL fold metallo-hydrolase [Phreatobacter stygius]|uniref:MBL fold metallo-hydrolase n=2 Tax=Phreatobacter stygius TaxID=1940610 RepID=A0A4D7BDL6_9HYPH|nr:MBL fold metallo-hydrolase [Phreatobacter stygius]